MRRRNLTREERAQRKVRIVCCVWFVLLASVMMWLCFWVTPPEPESEPGPTQLPPAAETFEEPDTLTAEEIETILMEDERIEAALIEQGYYRDDISLTYLEQDYLHTAADRAGIPYELALAVIQKETNFKNLIGDDGASVGYMQVQARWHRDRMERLGVTDLADPYGNFLVGCDYLGEMVEKDRGVEWALHAYNGGLSYANDMAKAGKVSQYVKDVLSYMNDLGGVNNGNMEF